MSVEQLITDNIDVWTSAIKTKSTSGRGSSNKLELYGTKKLRELILELAVRGKLVSQDPNDEPASKLLERIAAEKEQLIKDKKIKKQKPLPPIADGEKPFNPSKNWAWARFSNLPIQYSVGLDKGKSLQSADKEYRYFKMNNIGNEGGYDLNEITFVDATPLEVEKYSLKQFDFLFNTRNSKELVGKTCVFKGNNEPPILYNNNILRAEFLMPALALFLDVWMRSPSGKLELESLKSGTTNVWAIYQGKLETLVCPIPPLEEQKRIVAKVDELMALCDQLEAQTNASIEAHQLLVKTLLETLTNAKDADELNESWQRISEHFDVLFTTEDSIDQLKQTILQLAVMGKLVRQDPNDEPASELLERTATEKEQLIKDKKIKKQKPLPPISEDEKPFDLPDGWEWCRLQDVAYVFAGNSFKSQDFSEGEGAKVIKITNAGVNQLIETNDCLPFDFLKEYPNYIVHEGDLIIALTRPYISSGLKVSECPASYHNSLLNQRVAAIRILTGTRFTFKFLKSQFVLKLYQKRFSGSGLQPNLKMNDLTELVVPIPPKHEQKRIVAKVDELIEFCDALSTKLQALQEIQLNVSDSIVKQAS